MGQFEPMQNDLLLRAARGTTDESMIPTDKMPGFELLLTHRRDLIRREG